MKQYCSTCWQLSDAVRDAENRRAFVAQQVQDNGACMIERYREAIMIVKLACGALELHRETCGVYIGDRVTA